MTLQVGSPLILACEVLGLPSEVNSGLLVQWMKRGSASADVAGTGGVEVLILSLLPYLEQHVFYCVWFIASYLQLYVLLRCLFFAPVQYY